MSLVQGGANISGAIGQDHISNEILSPSEYRLFSTYARDIHTRALTLIQGWKIGTNCWTTDFLHSCPSECIIYSSITYFTFAKKKLPTAAICFATMCLCTLRTCVCNILQIMNTPFVPCCEALLECATIVQLEMPQPRNLFAVLFNWCIWRAYYSPKVKVSSALNDPLLSTMQSRNNVYILPLTMIFCAFFLEINLGWHNFTEAKFTTKWI